MRTGPHIVPNTTSWVATCISTACSSWKVPNASFQTLGNVRWLAPVSTMTSNFLAWSGGATFRTSMLVMTLPIHLRLKDRPRMQRNIDAAPIVGKATGQPCQRTAIK